jgi:hypothetical protein
MVGDMAKIVFFDGRSVGAPPRDRLLARNIAPAGENPEWRIEEAEYIRWLKSNNIIPSRRNSSYPK